MPARIEARRRRWVLPLRRGRAERLATRSSTLLAELHRAAGNLDTAIDVLEWQSRFPRWESLTGWPNGYEWIKMRALLASLYRDAGRGADADPVERELLELLAVADNDHPIKLALLAARAEPARR